MRPVPVCFSPLLSLPHLGEVGDAEHAVVRLPIEHRELALAEGGNIEGLALTEALWARMCAGTREDGSEIAPNDPHWDRLNAAALAAKTDPAHWLAQTEIYGSLGENKVFAEMFAVKLEQVWNDGCRSALQAFIAKA